MAVKGEGKANDLLDRVAADPAFAPVHDQLQSLIDPSLFIGRSPEQVRSRGYRYRLYSEVIVSVGCWIGEWVGQFTAE